jgi:hypothetical protein
LERMRLRAERVLAMVMLARKSCVRSTQPGVAC